MPLNFSRTTAELASSNSSGDKVAKFSNACLRSSESLCCCKCFFSAAARLFKGILNALVNKPPDSIAIDVLLKASSVVAKGSKSYFAISKPACNAPTLAPPFKKALPRLTLAPPNGKGIKLIGSNKPAPACAQKLELANTCLLLIPLSILDLRSAICCSF